MTDKEKCGSCVHQAKEFPLPDICFKCIETYNLINYKSKPSLPKSEGEYKGCRSEKVKKEQEENKADLITEFDNRWDEYIDFENEECNIVELLQDFLKAYLKKEIITCKLCEKEAGDIYNKAKKEERLRILDIMETVYNASSVLQQDRFNVAYNKIRGDIK